MPLLFCLLAAVAARVRGNEAPEATAIHLGKTVFHTQWSPELATQPEQFAGLGPLFNVASCVACHVGGAGGQGPSGPGAAPLALVVQLEAAPVRDQQEARGDPVYGCVFNTAAVGIRPEGTVLIQYREKEGYYYPDGARWHLRIPRYRLVDLAYGPVAPNTVVKPRLAPSLLGVGLLERVVIPDSRGRFGWQATSRSIRDQAQKAFALEMGLTSQSRPHDDCTAAESDCLRQPHPQQPEVSDERVGALVAYIRTLAVPERPPRAAGTPSGSELFVELGCPTCHRAQLSIEMTGPEGKPVSGSIAAYTDLELHDLGMDMADEDIAGRKVPTRWRTAPLWALGHRIRLNSYTTFLHDGRARSVEEAILWHGAEAAAARARFMDLGPRSRRALLQWLEAL